MPHNSSDPNCDTGRRCARGIYKRPWQRHKSHHLVEHHLTRRIHLLPLQYSASAHHLQLPSSNLGYSGIGKSSALPWSSLLATHGIATILDRVHMKL